MIQKRFCEPLLEAVSRAAGYGPIALGSEILLLVDL